MKISNIQLSDAWSFRADTPCNVVFDPNITVIIGKNNSGKSNIFRGLKWVAAHIRMDTNISLERNDAYDYGENHITAKPSLALDVDFSSDEKRHLESVFSGFVNKQQAASAVLSLPLSIRYKFAGALNNSVSLRKQWLPIKQQEGIVVNAFNQQVADQMTNWLHDYINKHLTLLSGWRSLSSKVEGDKTIIQVLHEMQGANTDNPGQLRLFDKVERFFLRLTGLNSGQLRISADGKDLNVRYRERYLPIKSFGDGVVHTLLMAFEFMRKQNHVFLIEEPETHLHPELIRMLMAEIAADKNNNQYIITTHSPVLLDTSTQKVTYCVEYSDDYSTVAKCETVKSLHHILDLLDARLSDLLQANCVIWVEGPTDRMFIKRCIELLAPKLVEGHHYQIAYYGGKLLAHYTADDNCDALLNVLKLNRNAAFIADSDASAVGEEPNTTKQRLKKEIEASRGLFWLTAGREIENYIPSRVLTKTYKALLPDHISGDITVDQFGRIDDVLFSLCADPPRGDGWKIDYASNKARLMPLFTQDLIETDLTSYDLRARLDQLIQFIQQANPSAT
jgi:predicted ATPase